MSNSEKIRKLMDLMESNISEDDDLEPEERYDLAVRNAKGHINRVFTLLGEIFDEPELGKHRTALLAIHNAM